MKEQKISKKATGMKKRNFLLIALCLIMLIQCCYKTTILKAASKNGIAIEFIDVASYSNGGKADATLIATKSNKGIIYTLVDCGTEESSTYLLDRLKQRGVKKIESLILTHNHSDHVGGLESLLKSNIKVNNIYMNERGGTKADKVKNIIKKYYGNKFSINSYGKMQKIVNINTGAGSSARIKLYTCNRNIQDNMDSLNDNSLVVEVEGTQVSGENLSCIILGDLRQAGLKGYQNTYGFVASNTNTTTKRYTVVKMGHHGFRKSFDVEEIEEEAKFYNKYFSASEFVFTANPSVFKSKDKLTAFTNTLQGKCWLNSSSDAKTSKIYNYSTKKIISYGDWNLM